MAGNKNAWRDIVSPAEWGQITLNARSQVRARSTGAPAAPVAPGGAAAFTPGVISAANLRTSLGAKIAAYDLIAKDDCAQFQQRAHALRAIAALAGRHTALSQVGFTPGVKSATGKQLTDSADIWVGSIGRRASKKAAYLDLMAQWHASAKDKYKTRAQLSLFLRGLAANHVRGGGDKLHAVPYATIEKVDPLHRQTFVFLDPNDPTNVDAVNPLGRAFRDYLAGRAASNPDRATKADASFYEWLEYHPFCIGTPVLSAGAANYKNQIKTVSYAGLDLGFVYAQPGGMVYERVLSGDGTTKPLNTTDFGKSGKGDPGAVAFVWDGDQNLWLHEHGSHGFVHASAKQGHKVRCAGMLNAVDGKLTRVSEESGHYAPAPENIYQFVDWLNNRGCLHPAADVRITHRSGAIKPDLYRMNDFMAYFVAQGQKRSVPLSHPTAKPALIP